MTTIIFPKFHIHKYFEEWKRMNIEIKKLSEKYKPKTFRQKLNRIIGIFSGYYAIYGPPEFREWEKEEIKKLSDKN